MARSDHSDRTKEERVQRLKERLAKIDGNAATLPLIAILKGILDLLADEL